MKRWCIFLAGLFGLTGLILSSIGAHALPEWIALPPDALALALQSWKTATQYQLLHALLLVLFAALLSKESHWSAAAGGGFAIVGIILFCGAIYLKVLTGVAFFAKFAPYGGVCLMIAWASLCVYAVLGLSRTRR